FHDHRSAYVFVVNSAGVLADGVLPEGDGRVLLTDLNTNWDGVWDARTHLGPDGWSAEIEIPFATLRLPKAPVQASGFHVGRYSSRLQESDDGNPIQFEEATFLGHFATLEGIRDVKPGLALQLLPYVSARANATFADDNLAPRKDFLGEAGLDFK